MGKYIIELEEPEMFDDRKFYTCSQMPWWAVSENIVENLTPYTEPDMEKVRKEAYEQGYQDAVVKISSDEQAIAEKVYQSGLNDAWAAARKIAHCFLWGSYQRETGRSSVCAQDVLDHYSASEAIEKIRQYEQEQEAFHVGDEFVNENGDKFVIITMDGKEIDRYVDKYGKTYVMNVKYSKMRKTGRHFPEIAEVLQKMKEES